MNWFVLALLAAIFAALTAIFGKVGVEKIDPNFATIVRSIIMVVFLLGVGFATGKLAPSFWQTLDKKAFLFIVLSGLAGATSWLFYFAALKVGLASKVAPIDRLSIVFVLLFAAIFLGEKLSLASIIGILLMTAGAVLLAL